MRDVRVIIAHEPDCWLREDPAPFVMYDGIDWDLNVNAVGRGSTSYYRFRCNDPQCSAVLRVRIGALAEVLGEMLDREARA